MFICFNFRLFDVAAIMFLWVKYLLWYQFKNHLIQFQPYVGNFRRGRWNNWKTRFVLSAFCPRTVRHGLTPNDVIQLWRHSGLSKQTFHPFHNRKDVKDQGDFSFNLGCFKNLMPRLNRVPRVAADYLDLALIKNPILLISMILPIFSPFDCLHWDFYQDFKRIDECNHRLHGCL